MAKYTLETTDEQERGLAWILAATNANRAAAEPRESELTALQLMQGKLSDILTPYVLAAERAEAEQVAAAYREADAQAQADVRASLGIE